MPDMNTLKITYLPETPFKTVDTILLVLIISSIIYVMINILKLIMEKKGESKKTDYSKDPMLGVTALYLLIFCCIIFLFEAPYADVCVKVVPNMDIREFDMNHSRDFIKKGDDYYFIKTIKTSLFEKYHAEQGEEGLSDVIKCSIECSVRGTREGDK